MNLQEKPYPVLYPSPDSSRVGLYMHVPFCATTCDFCAFYQNKPSRSEIQAYLQGIEQEASFFSITAPIQTVFWGGGTPGLLPVYGLEALGEVVHELAAGTVEEWSIELSPATVNPRKLAVLKELGVTRISMGIQSFDERLLKHLGREHSPDQIYRAYDMIRDAGFGNVNIDMMFALPGQTPEAWMADLAKAVALQSEHLSTYCLTFEEDTALWVKLQEGRYRVDVEKEVRFYQETWDYLGSVGFNQYEVSNYARSGYQCLHNLNTWYMQDWIGLGPSAASQYQGRRYKNVDDSSLWLAGVKQGCPEHIDVVELTEDIRVLDQFVFGLRMNDGVAVGAIKERFPSWRGWEYLIPLFERLEIAGYLRIEEERIALTDAGRLLADAIGTEILELEGLGETASL